MKKSKILVVDDNTKILYAFSTFLEKEGFLSIPVEEGREVLNIISRDKPCLIFLDISLADEDGFDILQQIKQKSPSMPVIMVSGHSCEENKQRATNLGASDFLEKPLSLAKIREILKKNLEK